MRTPIHPCYMENESFPATAVPRCLQNAVVSWKSRFLPFKYLSNLPHILFIPPSYRHTSIQNRASPINTKCTFRVWLHTRDFLLSLPLICSINIDKLQKKLMGTKLKKWIQRSRIICLYCKRSHLLILEGALSSLSKVFWLKSSVKNHRGKNSQSDLKEKVRKFLFVTSCHIGLPHFRTTYMYIIMHYITVFLIGNEFYTWWWGPVE